MIKQKSFKVQALYDFTAQDDDEISLKKGESITVLQTDEGFNDSWYTGMNSRGQCGLFPSGYVQVRQEAAKVSDLPPEEWSVEDVVQWLSRKGFGRKFVECFRQHAVDGVQLLKFDLTSLKELGVGTLDRRLRLLNQVSSLKRQQRQVESVVSSIRPVSFSMTPPQENRDFPVILLPKNRRHVVKNTIKVRSDMKCLSDVMLIPQHSLSLNIEYQGFLWKQGGSANWSWKRRYFVLKGMALWYFKDDNGDAKPLGLIPLPSYNVAPSVNCDIQKKKYTFEANHTDARTYYFRAESRTEMNGWMNAMIRSSLGLELPRKSNEYGLPKLRALKSLHDDMASFVDSFQQLTPKLESMCSTPEVVSRAPSVMDDKSRILSKIKRMGINPLEALPQQFSRLVLSQQEDLLNWAMSVVGQEVSIHNFSDSTFTYDFVRQVVHTEGIHELSLSAENNSQPCHVENFKLILEQLPMQNLCPQKFAQGDEDEIVTMLRILKDI